MVKARPPNAKASAAAKDNPFEKRGILRKKHEVFNRRVKGADRNVAAARSAAHERRKKTLLVDWKQNKKSNAFEDKRFGEEDPNLPLEEKMWMRLQRERTSQRSRRGAAFNLEDDGDGEEELLTHKGRALDTTGGANFMDGGLSDASDEDEDGALDAEVVHKLHFGGGSRAAGATGANGAGFGDADRPKSRREALEDIIAKSKEAKRDKARQKEDQEGVREELDEQLGDLLGMLQRRPTKNEMGRKGLGGAAAAAAKEARPKMDEYDMMARELVFDARARASERTMTPEETARRDKERLDELEKERQARMRAEVDGEGGDTDGLPLQGGKKRRRPSNDDELGDDVVDANAKTSGRGSQPILFPPEEPEEASGDDEEGEDNDGGGSSSDGSSSDDAADSEDDAAEGVVLNVSSGGAKEGEGSDEDGSSSSDEPGSEDGETALEEKLEKAAGVKSGAGDGASAGTKVKAGSAGAAAGAASKEGDHIPYVMECPTTMEELLALLAEHSRSAADVNTVIDRVRRYHSVRLDSRNREKINNLYSLLLRRLQRVAEQAVRLPPGGPMDRVVQLDFLARCLYDMTQETPDAAGALWHRTLGSLQQRLAKKLRDLAAGDPGIGAAGGAWPAPGALLLMRLLPQLFPASDFRHPVVTPAALLLGQCLAQCPVRGAADLTAGLFCAGLAIEFARPAGRFVPEAVTFLAAVLEAFAPPPPAAAASVGVPQGARVGGAPFSLEPPATDLLGRFAVATPVRAAALLDWLREAASAFSEEKVGDPSGEFAEPANPAKQPSMQLELRWLGLGNVEYAAEGNGYDEEIAANDGDVGPALDEEARPAFAAAVLATTYRLLMQAATQLRGCDAAADAMASAAEALARVRPTRTPALPPTLLKLHAGLEETLAGLWDAAAARAPLHWPKEQRPALKSLVPKYSERYSMRRDADEDRDRAQIKQMKRQQKRESKGAARELRRDAAFLAGARAAEEEKRRADRKKQLGKNRAWLDEQQASVKKALGQKQTRMAMRGGGSAPKKRPKVGRF